MVPAENSVWGAKDAQVTALQEQYWRWRQGGQPLHMASLQVTVRRFGCRNPVVRALTRKDVPGRENVHSSESYTYELSGGRMKKATYQNRCLPLVGSYR